MPYRFGHDDIDVFVESGTDHVPDDGAFYIVARGSASERFTNAKQALARLSQIRFTSGLASSLDESSAVRNAMGLELASRQLSEYSSKKADRTRKGGKGR